MLTIQGRCQKPKPTQYGLDPNKYMQGEIIHTAKFLLASFSEALYTAEESNYCTVQFSEQPLSSAENIAAGMLVCVHEAR